MTNDQKKQLEAQLWNIADSLRGKMNADEFRDYCLGFIFYKYLSERQYIYANQILSEDDLDYLDLDENSPLGQEYLAAVAHESIPNLGYFLKPSELFHSLVQRALGAKKAEEDNLKDEDFAQSNFILDDLTQVLNSIEKSTLGNDSEEDFDHLFEDLDLKSTKLGRTPKDKNTLIAKILVHLDKIDFRLHDSESDVLGDAYEYLIGQFASGAGKKAGEFYTPQAVSRVLAKIVTTGKKRLKSVYDPTCGSGSLLLRVSKEVEEVGDYFGQEMNRTTYNLARMNMILHGVHYGNFDLRQEDTLERPQHEGKKFEAVVANPPFSANWSANKLFESDDRFSQYGALAPKSKADFAFVQHMIHHLADNGIMAVVLPHGVLFRGATEGRIRQYLIKERNWLDAVIGLPANIFYGTSIPTCILVFKKCRENPKDILFIDGSGHFEKAKNQNYLRDEDINKIIDTYRGRLVEEKYSYRASLAEIAENDFNLNIPRYVDTFEEEADIDLADIIEELKEIDQEITGVDLVIQEFCQELNIDRVSSVDKGKKKVPGLRFPEFSGEWKETTLGKISDKPNYGVGASAINFDGKHKYLRITDIDDETRCFLPNPLTSPDSGISSDYKVKENDLIFARTGASVGKSYLYNKEDGDLYFAGYLIRFSIKNANSRFIYYITLTSKYSRWILVTSMRSGQPGINAEEYSNFSFYIPKIEEQEKIAKFLGECDRILTLLRRKRELLESYKRGVMQLLFTQKIRFKDDDGSDFPDWEVKKLKDVFKWIKTNCLSRENLNYDFGTIQNIHYGDIHKKFRCQFKLNQENVPYLNSLNLLPNLEQDDFCKVGDIVIADASEDYADIGKAIEIIEVEPNKLVAGLHCFIARPKTKIIVGYSGYLFQTNNVRQQIKNIAQGISVLGISKSNLEKINIPYPSIKEQEKIAQFLTAIDKKIEMVGRQIEGRGKFKQGLLQKMFV